MTLFLTAYKNLQERWAITLIHTYHIFPSLPTTGTPTPLSTHHKPSAVYTTPSYARPTGLCRPKNASLHHLIISMFQIATLGNMRPHPQFHQGDVINGNDRLCTGSARIGKARIKYPNLHGNSAATALHARVINDRLFASRS